VVSETIAQPIASGPIRSLRLAVLSRLSILMHSMGPRA
jgi:hypothetical protein